MRISLSRLTAKAPQSFGITASTTYKNIDGDVKFEHKPNKEDIVTEEEFEKLMAQDAMNFKALACVPFLVQEEGILYIL